MARWVVLASVLTIACAALSGPSQDGRRREPGGRRMRRSEKDKVDETCGCVRTPQTRHCQQRMEDFGPILIRGECYNNGVPQRPRREARRSSEVNPSPMFIVEDPQQDTHTACVGGDKPLILLSSGHKSNISLTGVPAVLVCPGSLSPFLLHLTITEVPLVKVGKGALQPRNTHFTLSVSGGGRSSTLVVPEGGLQVDTGEVREYGSELSGVLVEAEESVPTTPQMEVKVEVRNVSEVEFESLSVVAPRVSVVLEGVTEVTLAPRAIIPYTNPEISSLQVLSTGRVTLHNQSVTIGMINITKVNKLQIHEGGVEISHLDDLGEGGSIHLKEVLEASLGEGAITFPRGGSLSMQNVLVNRAGRRAVTVGSSTPHVTSPLLTPLTSPLLTTLNLYHVVFENTDPVAFCLPAKNVILSDVVVLRGVGGEGVRTAVCASAAKDLHAMTLRDVAEGSAVASAAVVCVSQLPRPDICPDPRCHLCNPHTPKVSVSPAPSLASDTNTTEVTQLTSEIPTTQLSEATLQPTTTSTSTPPITQAPSEGKGSWVARLPHYALPLLLVLALAALALITCCIYKIRTRGKQAEYNVPRSQPRHTFPRTIITRDTLNSHPAPPRPAPRHAPHNNEMYVSFTADASSLQASVTSEEASVASHESFSDRHQAFLLGRQGSEADQYSQASSQDLPHYGY